ncbi:hypothetical protein [Lysinibacillus xylanilyticus]|uniref:hypothetical protein n=1 Tax=Lysinibacillus xylanilyticus TaxID=582475 RepID=UPI00382B35C8
MSGQIFLSGTSLTLQMDSSLKNQSKKKDYFNNLLNYKYTFIKNLNKERERNG